MYETYVPIPETTEERKPPTIAEIVREKTDDGARIIDFFLDLMEGRVADTQLCHRIDAAKQLVKYGSKKAADFIAEHRDEPCDHCESRKRGPRPRKDDSPVAGPLHVQGPLGHVQGPFGYDFLTLLTEDFLTVLSAVDEDLMIKLVRAQTRDGGTVIDFLDDVMYGRNDGFKPNHRIAAARELISHILRDEHRSHILLDDVGADPRVRPLPALPGAAREPGNPLSIVPAHPVVVPAEAEGDPDTPVVVPAKAGTQRGSGARSAAPNTAAVEPVEQPVPSTDDGSLTSVHPEPVEGPRPEFTGGPADNTIVVPAKAGTQRGGEGRTDADEPSAHPEPTPTVVPAGAGTQGGGGAGSTDDKDEEAAPAELTPAGQRIDETLERHWHDPDPRDGPIDSTTPGRSPPW